MASENVGELLENHEKARKLIKKNSIDGRLFRQAAEEGNLNMVKFFLKAKDHNELLPLEKEKCTNEGAEDENGMTPLHLAALNGHTRVVQSLVSFGANVHVRNKNKETALFLASREGHKSVVNILLHHGAHPYFRTLNGKETPFDIAAARCHWAVVECLVNGASLNSVPFNFYKLVAETGIDPNIVDKNGMTVLHQAKDVELVNYLLDCNVLVDARDSMGNTPLHRACHGGRSDIVKILIDSGAYVNTTNNGNKNPLYMTVLGKTSKEHFKVAKTLLENDADVNMRCRGDDDTTLQCAVRYNKKDFIQLFLDWGADVNAENKYGYSALYEAAFWTNVEIAQLLIEQGAKVNAVSKEGDTPLHEGAKRNNVEFSRLLIERGANVNAVNEKGYTPLHVAAEWEKVEIALLLIERGAKVNAVNEEGDTPLHLAFMGRMRGFLLKKGADVTIRNIFGLTPLQDDE